MSETPIFTVPEYQGRLTDREIENRVSEAENRGDFDLWEDEIAPPIWDGPDFTRHEEVQPLNPQQIEAQPSIVEQHNHMTDAQNVAYIGAITPYVAAHRDATIRQNLPVYQSDYALGA